jgi:hypothetical protein
VRPAQGRNSGDLKVTVLADSVIGVKANENAAKSHSALSFCRLRIPADGNFQA